MEFNEKLQELRRRRGLTQEELADTLYVSRTAVSRWESGRGYPNIDSLRDISTFFSVSIDDLLSGEHLLNIAENENRRNIRRMCGWVTGIVDIMVLALIVLPLYPHDVNGFIYTVSLVDYTGGSYMSKSVYWAMFISLAILGILRIVVTRTGRDRIAKWLSLASFSVSVSAVLYLALTRVVYGVAVCFILLIIKSILLFRESGK